jgi:CheY-like chemotaxis protein
VIQLDPFIKIDKAYNGSEALDIVIKDLRHNKNKKCSYKLILMDCNMPFMDGY